MFSCLLHSLSVSLGHRQMKQTFWKMVCVCRVGHIALKPNSMALRHSWRGSPSSCLQIYQLCHDFSAVKRHVGTLNGVMSWVRPSSARPILEADSGPKVQLSQNLGSWREVQQTEQCETSWLIGSEVEETTCFTQLGLSPPTGTTRSKAIT